LASKVAKRALLRHLADLVRWSCAVSAYLQDRSEPKCDNSKCSWICFQSELETADELSMSERAVKRTRRALVSDEWIKVTQGSIGRGAVTFYELNAAKLEAGAKPKRQGKRCKLPPFLRTEDIEKGSTVPPLSATQEGEGEQPALERGAPCPEKGGSLPLLYKKNRIEPEGTPADASAPDRVIVYGDEFAQAPPPKPTLVKSTKSITDADVKNIRLAYPRKVAPEPACKAIRAHHALLVSGKVERADGTPLPKMTSHEATAFSAGPDHALRCFP
jgi:hypothetical protein